MLCQVVFFRNLRGFFVRDVRAKGFAVSERGKDAFDGEDLFFFCHFNFHAVSIAERVGHSLSYPKDFCDFFSHVWHDGWHGDCWGLGTGLAMRESL